jgi:hypothetical protein
VSALLLLVYAGIATLGGLLLTRRQPGWRTRAAVIVALPALSFALWQAAQPPQGWPTSGVQPREAGFLWGVIREPDPQTNDPGRIFLWLDTGASRPRAYSLPYTRQLHRQVQAALDATKKGRQIDVTRSGGNRRSAGGGRQRGQHGSRLMFYPHPPFVLPPKKP